MQVQEKFTPVEIQIRIAEAGVAKISGLPLKLAVRTIDL
jgi:hypothetical protein